MVGENVDTLLQSRMCYIQNEGWETMTDLTDILKRHEGREGTLLPILHDVQAAFGCVSEDSIRAIAHGLNLTRAEVYGVVSFYHDFKTAHDARPVLKLCRAESCKARGVERLVSQAETAAGMRVKVETVYCLGLCSVGPAAMVGKDVHARLTPERIAKLVWSL
jgi:formate dehydrogenase subunit gamma